MICNYLIDIFNRNVNIMLYAVLLDKWKGSRNLEIKTVHVVNNLFYLIIYLNMPST